MQAVAAAAAAAVGCSVHLLLLEAAFPASLVAGCSVPHPLLLLLRVLVLLLACLAHRLPLETCLLHL